MSFRADTVDNLVCGLLDVFEAFGRELGITIP
jgi:hypothetical protein